MKKYTVKGNVVTRQNELQTPLELTEKAHSIGDFVRYLFGTWKQLNVKSADLALYEGNKHVANVFMAKHGYEITSLV